MVFVVRVRCGLLVFFKPFLFDLKTMRIDPKSRKDLNRTGRTLRRFTFKSNTYPYTLYIVRYNIIT